VTVSPITDPTQVLSHASYLEQRIARLPKILTFGDVDWERSRLHRRDAIEELREELAADEASLSPMSGGGYSFRWFGFRATCTSDAEGAMRNWIAQVRVKLGGVDDG